MKNEPNNINEIKIRGIKSVKWVFLGNVFNIVLKPLVTVLLARLLVPQDFGIVGIATLIISFANVFQDMGLGRALIQRKDNISSSANVVFWSNLVFGIFVYIVLFFSAPLISSFFKEPKVTDVIRVIGVQVIINAFGTVHFALLQRDFYFYKLFWIHSAPIILSAGISIVLAVTGYGYWSLIWGTLLGSAAGVLIARQQTSFRPVFSFDTSTAKQLLGFGIFILIESIQAWVLNYGDNIVVGSLIGVERLGVYILGFSLVTLLTWSATTQLAPVAYSSFSRLQNNIEELKHAYLNLTKLIILVSLPIAVGLSITARPIVSIIFGDKWQGLDRVLQILAILPGLGFIWGLNSELYKALGRPDIMPKLHLATIAYIIPVYLLVAPYGLVPFCFARASVGLIFGPLHIIIISKILKIPVGYIWRFIKKPLFAVLVMGLAVISSLSFFESSTHILDLLKLLSIIGLGAIVYAVMIWILDKTTVKMLFRIVKQAI